MLAAMRLASSRVSNISDLEAGQRNPTALTLQRLAKVLRVTPVVFFL
jgi:transcriptional regulator with XRE-family HTH domain